MSRTKKKQKTKHTLSWFGELAKEKSVDSLGHNLQRARLITWVNTLCAGPLWWGQQRWSEA